MSIEKKYPKPIDLTVLENSYYSLKRDEPEKFTDREAGEGYGERIHVRYKTKNGEMKRENLSTVSDPSWDPEGGAWGYHDGFLSYQEAKGKSFLIPNFFCNASGLSEIKVNNFSDFNSLRHELTRPIFNENHRPWRCVPGERTPSAKQTSESMDSTPKENDLEYETLSLLEAGISHYLGDLRDDDLQGFQEHFQEAIASIGSLASFGAIPSYAFGVGIGKAINDFSENGKINWGEFEDAINMAQAEEGLTGEDSQVCTGEEDVCDGSSEDWEEGEEDFENGDDGEGWGFSYSEDD